MVALSACRKIRMPSLQPAKELIFFFVFPDLIISSTNPCKLVHFIKTVCLMSCPKEFRPSWGSVINYDYVGGRSVQREGEIGTLFTLTYVLLIYVISVIRVVLVA